MSAAEDDTELRDILIQNLENSGVLNKLKAEMRAAVFLAMEEQDKMENKTPLINEKLKKSLNTKDGRLVAGLILDFLQVFNLDFTQAVFQPEINTTSGLQSRETIVRELDLCEENNDKSPLLLQLVRRGESKEPSQKQIAVARKKFDVYDKDGSGSVQREDLKSVFSDLFPSFNRNMLERFISDELKAADRSFHQTIDFQLFLGFYQRLFAQCRTVVCQDSELGSVHSVCPEEKADSPAVSKECGGVASLGKGDSHQNHQEEEGDSFFDDPLPKPHKTYGCLVPSLSPMRRGSSLSDLSAAEHTHTPEPRKVESPRENPVGSNTPEQGHTALNSRERGHSKGPHEKTGSMHLDDDVDYDDDFNSHRSDFSKSELSIGEEIEEVSIEGPDNSDKVSDESTVDLSVSHLSHSQGADYMEDVP